MKSPKCPHCARVLQSRIAKACSWCGSAIPETLRFSPAEVRKIKAEEAARQRQLAALERANESAQAVRLAKRGGFEAGLHAGLQAAKKLLD